MRIDLDPDAELPLSFLDLPEAEIERRFAALQKKLIPLWKSIERLSHDEQTIVVVPSLTVDYALSGATLQAYEERFLFLLLLLRQPRARLVYVTSQAVQPSIIDYYLCLLPGVIASHARERLHLVTPLDGTSRPLSVKLLQRPRLLERIRSLIHDVDRAHLVPFNTTPYERELALRLGIPMYGADPAHLEFGTKSGCRKLFAASGVALPAGLEDICSKEELIDGIAELHRRRPDIDEVMVKHNEGVSGEGNAVLSMTGLDASSREAVEQRILGMQLESKSMTIDEFLDKLAAFGGVVEERIVGDEFRSPSAQLRVTPLGSVELLSTHDQLLAGPSGQVYQGCVFPADRAYASAIAREATRIGERLAAEGVLGRFAIDFVSVRRGARWESYAIELNLRKGGTTHPFLTLQFLTDGTYDAEAAVFTTPMGTNKCFVASDNVESPRYRAFTADDLFDIAVRRGLHFDQTREKGVVFHMLPALGERGRLGLTAVGDTPEEADAFYRGTIEVLDDEARVALAARGLP